MSLFVHEDASASCSFCLHSFPVYIYCRHISRQLVAENICDLCRKRQTISHCIEKSCWDSEEQGEKVQRGGDQIAGSSIQVGEMI